MKERARVTKPLAGEVALADDGADRRSGAIDAVQEQIVAAIGVGLQDSGKDLQMVRGMLLPPIPRGTALRRRWCAAAKGTIIADIGPDVRCLCLILGQDRHRRVVIMQPFVRQNVSLDQRMKRLSREGASANLVGQGRDAQINPLAGIALTLPAERLMLAEFLEQDHGQKVRSGKAARCPMEGRGRLRDGLARPAGEPLAHGLDHLPMARNHLQCFGDVLPKLRQLPRAAAGPAVRRRDDDTSARQMLRKGFARRKPALEV